MLGYSELRLIFRHLLPNAITPVIVYWMTDMALAILLGSSLGYLGLGAQPPTAEWGVLIADGKNFMNTAGGCRSFPASPSWWPASRLQPVRRRPCRPVPEARDERRAAVPEPLLSVRGLSVAFGTPRHELIAVDGVDFDVAPGRGPRAWPANPARARA